MRFSRLTTPVEALFSKEQYCVMVERAKAYIREGDIFQVVLSNRLGAGFEGSLPDVYRILRTVNPSPYLFYFTSDDMELSGASPETLVKLGSTVRGELREGLDAVDAILPAGALSGAPKLRAAEIIDELEDNKRGVYGGAVGYLDFTGNLDVCIAIRLAFAKSGKVFIRSGAGIVADSEPEKEYQECINKALELAQKARDL